MQTVSADTIDCNRDTSRPVPPTPYGATKAARTNTTWGNKREVRPLMRNVFRTQNLWRTTKFLGSCYLLSPWKMRLRNVDRSISIPLPSFSHTSRRRKSCFLWRSVFQLLLAPEHNKHLAYIFHIPPNRPRPILPAWLEYQCDPSSSNYHLHNQLRSLPPSPATIPSIYMTFLQHTLNPRKCPLDHSFFLPFVTR